MDTGTAQQLLLAILFVKAETIEGNREEAADVLNDARRAWATLRRQPNPLTTALAAELDSILSTDPSASDAEDYLEGIDRAVNLGHILVGNEPPIVAD